MKALYSLELRYLAENGEALQQEKEVKLLTFETPEEYKDFLLNHLSGITEQYRNDRVYIGYGMNLIKDDYKEEDFLNY